MGVVGDQSTLLSQLVLNTYLQKILRPNFSKKFNNISNILQFSTLNSCYNVLTYFTVKTFTVHVVHITYCNRRTTVIEKQIKCTTHIQAH